MVGRALASPEVIDDQLYRHAMENDLARHLVSADVPSVETLREQLEERKSTSALALSVAASTPGSLSHTEVWQLRRDSIVGVGHLFKCDQCDNWHANIAGGVMLTSDGIGVTNYHVLDQEKAAIFGVVTRDGRVFPIVEILAASKEDDAAIFRVKGEGFSVAPLSGGDEAGTPVTAITHPNGNFYMVTDGIVARNYREHFRGGSARQRIAITADYAKGSSGCGIFNDRGELAAIVTSTKSIYYDRKDDIDRNLQMVVKVCIPTSAIRQLTVNPESATESE